MSLETAITRAWQRQALWLWALLPISWLYGLISLIRHQAYKLGWLKSYRAPIPVMVIGNITVGGSGKTPLIMALVSHLQQHKVRVGVISRGYGGDSSKMPTLVTTASLPTLVTTASLPSEVGDEPSLIVNMTGVPMAVCPNRQQAIAKLLDAHPNLQLIIADDGLQHYALQRDIEWIVVDVARSFGNRQLLPTGVLREPMSRLNEATVIYHKKLDDMISSDSLQSDRLLTMHLQPNTLQALWQNLSLDEPLIQNNAPPLGTTVHAVSGIGYPQRFFATLESLGFVIIAHPYPDHYDFELADLLQYQQYPIIVTSKDAVKIGVIMADQLNNSISAEKQAEVKELIARLWVLPVTAELSAACYDTLQQQLTALGVELAD